MIFGGGSSRIFIHREPVDMRKQYDGLAALVTNAMKRDVMSGDTFVFVGRDRRRAKALLWDGTGMCLVAKRLPRGHFAPPWTRAGTGALTLTLSELALFFESSDLVLRMPLSPPKYAPERDQLRFT